MEAYKLSPTLLTRASPKVSLRTRGARSDTFDEARFALAEREAIPSVMRSKTFSPLLLSDRVNCFVVHSILKKKREWILTFALFSF